MSYETKNCRYVAPVSQYGYYNQSGTRPRPPLLLIASQASLTAPPETLSTSSTTRPTLKSDSPALQRFLRTRLGPLSSPYSPQTLHANTRRRAARYRMHTVAYIPADGVHTSRETLEVGLRSNHTAMRVLLLCFVYLLYNVLHKCTRVENQISFDKLQKFIYYFKYILKREQMLLKNLNFSLGSSKVLKIED